MEGDGTNPNSSSPIRFCFLLILPDSCSVSLPVDAKGNINPTSLTCSDPQGAAMFNLTQHAGPKKRIFAEMTRRDVL